MRRLSSEQLKFFRTHGYLAPLRVFDDAEVDAMQRVFEQAFELLEADETPYCVDSWEKNNKAIYGIVMDPRILDLVEDLIGRDFYQWSSQVLCKQPFERLYVPWHQDVGDWPLAPADGLLTAWLALDDTDEENGCMFYVPGSHRRGRLEHIFERAPAREDGAALFPLHMPDLPAGQAVPICLRRGEMSVHHAMLVHGSEGNCSPRRRFGFQIAYAASHVRCDTSIRNANGDWSGFDFFAARGSCRVPEHIRLSPPQGFGRMPRKQYRILEERAG